MDMSSGFEEQFVQAFETATLKGERVALVGLRESDVEAVYALVQESRDHLTPHLPWVKDTSIADIRKKARGWILAEQLSQGGCWCILEKNENGSPVGFIMLDVNLSNRSAAISYWLGKKFTGKGYATQALQLLSDFALKTLRLNRLEVFASVHNEKSAAVALRAGFKEEGVCRDYEMVGETFVDHRRFSLLKRDLTA